MNFDKLGVNCRRIVARIRRLQNKFIAYHRRKSLASPRYFQENFDWKLIDSGFSSEKFHYRDEKWNQVKVMGALGMAEWYGQNSIPVEDNVPISRRVFFDEDVVSVDSSEKDPLRWVILKYYKNLGDVFTFEFSVKIKSIFTELQFAFNWETIATRDRFMICDNYNLIFQNVYKGAFIAALADKRKSLKIGESVRFRIQVMKTTYSISINDEVILSFDSAKTPAINGADFAFIFFEKTAERLIKLKLWDLKIFEGIKKEDI